MKYIREYPRTQLLLISLSSDGKSMCKGENIYRKQSRRIKVDDIFRRKLFIRDIHTRIQVVVQIYKRVSYNL